MKNAHRLLTMILFQIFFSVTVSSVIISNSALSETVDFTIRNDIHFNETVAEVQEKEENLTDALDRVKRENVYYKGIEYGDPDVAIGPDDGTGTKMFLYYAFADDKLNEIVYMLGPDFYDLSDAFQFTRITSGYSDVDYKGIYSQNDFLEEYNKICRTITDKYGEPVGAPNKTLGKVAYKLYSVKDRLKGITEWQLNIDPAGAVQIDAILQDGYIIIAYQYLPTQFEKSDFDF